MRRRGLQNALRLPTLLLLPMLNGCLVHTRVVKQAKVPSVVMTATADQLVQSINQQCQAIHSFSASVEFGATVGGPRKGKEKTYTSFSGYILLRRPESLRVIGLLPVVRTRAFDMATDGDTFKLLIPHNNKVIEGSNSVTRESPNALENFRPNVFSDSLLINCIGSNDLVTLTSETKNMVDPKSKELLEQPDYDLTVVRRKENSQELIPERVIHFSRIDLHPYQEDIYDAKGPVKFPGTITIKRPLEELQIVITFQKLSTNLTLTDDQFEVKIPSGMTVQQLQ
jgi:outer membrane lipoprotein-sorting protein